MTAVLRENIALPDGRAVLGTLVAGHPAARSWTAVSSRPCCLAAFPAGASASAGSGDAAGGEQARMRWFFPGQPISVSQTATLARQGEFVVLLDDGGVWLCSFASRQAARPSKRSKHASAKSKGLSFAIENDARSCMCRAPCQHGVLRARLVRAPAASTLQLRMRHHVQRCPAACVSGGVTAGCVAGAGHRLRAHRTTVRHADSHTCNPTQKLSTPKKTAPLSFRGTTLAAR